MRRITRYSTRAFPVAYGVAVPCTWRGVPEAAGGRGAWRRGTSRAGPMTECLRRRNWPTTHGGSGMDRRTRRPGATAQSPIPGERCWIRRTKHSDGREGDATWGPLLEFPGGEVRGQQYRARTLDLAAPTPAKGSRGGIRRVSGKTQCTQARTGWDSRRQVRALQGPLNPACRPRWTTSWRTTSKRPPWLTRCPRPARLFSLNKKVRLGRVERVDPPRGVKECDAPPPMIANVALCRGRCSLAGPPQWREGLER